MLLFSISYTIHFLVSCFFFHWNFLFCSSDVSFSVLLTKIFRKKNLHADNYNEKKVYSYIHWKLNNPVTTLCISTNQGTYYKHSWNIKNVRYCILQLYVKQFYNLILCCSIIQYGITDKRSPAYENISENRLAFYRECDCILKYRL